MSRITETIKNMPDFYSEKDVSSSEIEKAENVLGLRFAHDFRECLNEYGAVSLGCHDFTGFSADANLDIVYVTEKCRHKNEVSDDLYVIEESNIDGIVVWQDANGVVYKTTPCSNPEKIADSFLDYISER